MSHKNAWKTDQEKKYRREILKAALNEYWKCKCAYLDETITEKKKEIGKLATIKVIGEAYSINASTLRAFKYSEEGQKINEHWRKKKGWSPDSVTPKVGKLRAKLADILKANDEDKT